MSTSSTAIRPSRSRYEWIEGGDVNAFFGLMIDNISGMILMTSLLAGFGMPRDFVLGRMIPGTAVGVLAGDLVFTAMAFRLARRTGRSDVTAMPPGAGYAQHVRLGDPDHRPLVPGGAREGPSC